MVEEHVIVGGTRGRGEGDPPASLRKRVTPPRGSVDGDSGESGGGAPRPPVCRCTPRAVVGLWAPDARPAGWRAACAVEGERPARSSARSCSLAASNSAFVMRK